MAKGSATSQRSEPQTHPMPEVAHTGIFGGFGREEPTQFLLLLPALLKAQTCLSS